MQVCPFSDRLRAFLANELTEAEKHAVTLHVSGCYSCRQQLDQMTLAPTGFQRPAALHDDSTLPPSQSDSENLRTLFPAASPTAASALDIPGYAIQRELGRGGMGVVYEARQLALQRTVALKVVLNGAHSSPMELARFHDEAELIARLHHPNIVQIYDVGQATHPYLVLEFAAGGSLARQLKGTPLPARAASRMVQTLARAVQAAHASGVVHRDLKPANVLLFPDEKEGAAPVADSASLPEILSRATPKITDFGLAKRFEAAGTAETLAPGLTQSGELLGTPCYMAPEQAAVPKQTVGPPADVYALGAILYELLTGRPPFKGETVLDTILQVQHNEPVPVTALQPKAPRDLETICMKCLRKDPAARYESALDLAADLERFERGEPIQARPVGSLRKAWRWMRRHPVAAGVLAAGLLAPIVAATLLSFLSARLVRSSALDSAKQQAEVLEEANGVYSRIVQQTKKDGFAVNITVPPTPGTVPLSIPATFLHDIGSQLGTTSPSGIQVRQYSDYPFPWRKDGGPRDDFEHAALTKLQETSGHETYHEFAVLDGKQVVRYAQARVLRHDCVECHNTHPESPKKDWKEGDVRGVLEIIRPLDKDEARVGDALRLVLLVSAGLSVLLIAGSLMAVRFGRRAA